MKEGLGSLRNKKLSQFASIKYDRVCVTFKKKSISLYKHRPLISAKTEAWLAVIAVVTIIRKFISSCLRSRLAAGDYEARLVWSILKKVRSRPGRD